MEIFCLQRTFLLCLCVFYLDYIQGGEYLGCFIDQIQKRALKGEDKVDRRNTIEGCISWCAGLNRTYAGTQYGKECFCGDNNDYDRHGNTSVCTKKCSGDRRQICGGSYAISIYTVCPRGYYTGSLTLGSCKDECHCKDGDICPYSTGECPNGCQAGWKGFACNNRGCSENNGGCAHICDVHKRTDWCSCHQGFGKAYPGDMLCPDIDECAENNGTGPCEHHCDNTVGSYRCYCEDGFILSGGKYCSEVPEVTEAPECWHGFHRQVTTNSKVSSICPRLITLLNADLETCFKQACSLNANVVNVLSGVCDIRLCSDMYDMQLSTQHGAWDVYTCDDVAATAVKPPSLIDIKITIPMQTILPGIMVPLLLIFVLALVLYKRVHRESFESDKLIVKGNQQSVIIEDYDERHYDAESGKVFGIDVKGMSAREPATDLEHNTADEAYAGNANSTEHHVERGHEDTKEPDVPEETNRTGQEAPEDRGKGSPRGKEGSNMNGKCSTQTGSTCDDHQVDPEGGMSTNTNRKLQSTMHVPLDDGHKSDGTSRMTEINV